MLFRLQVESISRKSKKMNAHSPSFSALVKAKGESPKVLHCCRSEPLPRSAFTSVAAFEGLFTAHDIFSLLKKKLFPVLTLSFKPQSIILMLETQRKVCESRN